ncbi:MAG: hypothetical protein ACU841_16520 [Gammaproteobacteria bacterium]
MLEFELKDMTLAPGIPSEKVRTASIKPMLENELSQRGYEIVAIPVDSQREADAGAGYLFDHHDSTAALARKFAGDDVSEVKGGEKQLTQKGVESLASKIDQTLKRSTDPRRE